MAERNVTFLILAKDFASRVMKNVGDSTDRTAKKLRDLNVLGLGPLATAAAALGPALLPVMGAAVVGTAGLGVAFASAGAAAGVFGAVVATTFKEVADASKKGDDLRKKIHLLTKEIELSPGSGVSAKTLLKQRDKAILEYTARLAQLPAPTRAAVMALDRLKNAWTDFVDKAKPQTLSILTRGFSLLAGVIPKLQPLFNAGAQAASYLVNTLQRFVSNGGLDKIVSFLATRAGPAFESFGGIILSLGAGIGYLLAPFVSTSNGIVNGLDRMSYAFAGWARTTGAAGVRDIIAYVNANGPRMGALFIGIAKSLASLAQAAGPLAPVSLAIATALTQIINALPQPVLTALIGGFIAWSVAMQGAMVATRIASAVGVLAGVIAGLITAMTGGTLATEANTAAKVAYSIATGIGTAATTLFAGAVWLANAALAVLTAPITLIVLGIAALVVGVIMAYKHITVFRNAVNAVGHAFVVAGQWLAGAFMSAVRAVPGIISSIVGFFQALPGRILGAIVAFPGMYLRFWQFVLEKGAFIIGYAIGRTIRFFIQLPGQIMRGIGSLAGLLSRFWQSVWNRGITLAVSGSRAIVAFFRGLPGRAASAISSLGGRVGAFFRSAWNSAVSITVNGISRAVAFFRSLPGKAASALSSLPGRIRGAFSGAASWLVSAGADVIRGLIQGIGNMAGAAVGEARRIASNIVSGVMSGLGIGSPSKVMADKVGKWIPPGIGVGIQNALPGLLSTITGMKSQIVNTAAFDARTRIKWGEVSEATWKRLLAQGWRGNPKDKMEALYAPASRSAALPFSAGNGAGMVVNVTVNGALDPVAVGRQIVTVLERWAQSQGKTFELAH